MRKSQPAHSVANSRSCTWDFSLLRTITQIFRITLHLLLLQAAHPPRHFERSRPTFSSRFAPAKRSACAERNLSSPFLTPLRASIPSRINVSLFSFRHTTLPCHPPHCPRIAPRKETASLCAPFSPVAPTAIPCSDSVPARARPAPQIQNRLRAAVSAASPALQTSFPRAPPPPRPPPAPLAKPSPSLLPASWLPSQTALS